MSCSFVFEYLDFDTSTVILLQEVAFGKSRFSEYLTCLQLALLIFREIIGFLFRAFSVVRQTAAG